jgi:glycosyltransferase involved in cell wall biosynthesis
VGAELGALIMHVLYHHRTTGQDAQGIHIREILHALRVLGASTELVSFADRHGQLQTVRRSPEAVEGERYRWLGRLKSMAWVYECAEIAYNLWGVQALTRAILRRRPDMIYERYSLFNFSGVLVSKLFRVPLVLEVNAPLAYEKETYEKLSLRRLAYALERWICSNSTRTIVVSTPMRDILERQGVPRQHMTVISNGVNSEEIMRSVGRVDVRQRHGLGGRLVLGFVGWFKPWHRLDRVIDLLADNEDWRDRMHLLLVGDGPEADTLRRRARERGVEDNVTITGAVGREEIYDHIQAFDIALQPHVTPYASPMKIFEYLALGKCVIAPDLQNIREILTAGEDAVFFRAGDANDMARAIQELARDPERVRCMGWNARQTIEKRRYYWLDNARRALALVGLTVPVSDVASEVSTLHS